MQVGDKVFLVGNECRGNSGVREAEIKKVGRKYIEVGFTSVTWSSFKFYKDTLEQVTNYSPDYYLYLDIQEYLNEQEYENIYKFIRRKVDSWQYRDNLSLDQLRRIKSIMEEEIL